MSIIFLIGGNDDPVQKARSLAVCDELKRSGEPPALFSRDTLPLSILRRYPCRWVLPSPQPPAAEVARVAREMVDYARLSTPAIVFEDAHTPGLSLPPDILRIMIVGRVDFPDLLRLRREHGATYDRFLIADSPASYSWRYDAAQTEEILSWPRWSHAGQPISPGLWANESGRLSGIESRPEPNNGEVGAKAGAEAGVEVGAKVGIDRLDFSAAREKPLAIRIDQVIELDERLDWLLSLLGRLNLCASLEVAPYLCRIEEPDLARYDESFALFEVSQHGYASLPMTYGDEAKGEFSRRSEDPTSLEIDNLRKGFEKLSETFPRRFNRGFSPPFDSIPDWLPRIWKDLNGRFISCITSRPHGSPLPVVRLHTDLWDRELSRPRSAESVLKEALSRFAECGRAGLILRPQQLGHGPARRSLERILEALAQAGAIGCPLGTLAVRQADASGPGGRLDFTLRSYNLDEALEFLDLCEERRAVPRYRIELEDESAAPSLFAALERLDKELWSRGFSDEALADSFRSLNRALPRKPLKRFPWPQMIYGDSTDEGAVQVARGISRAESSARPAIVIMSDSETAGGGEHVSSGHTEIPLRVAEDRDVETILRRCAAVVEAAAPRERAHNHLVIHASSALKSHLAPALKWLERANIGEYSIQIPYFDGGKITSALEWRDFVSAVRKTADENGWRLLGGRPDPCALGLDIRNQYPEAEVTYERRSQSSVDLSIVSSAHNRRTQLPAFLGSVNGQEGAGSFELVLVDDGSSDGSEAVARELCPQLEPHIDVTLIRLKRALPYLPGTFTFRAGAARQRGVDMAVGEQILFLDPDQEVRPDCVAQHRRWNGRGFDVVIGDRDRAYSLNEAYDSESIYRARMSRRALHAYRNWWQAFYTGNSSVSRAALDAAGGFDESLQYWGLDDTDLAYRLARAGATFWHTLRAGVTHIDHIASGGGSSARAREKSCWLMMETLFRKYLDDEILDAYSYLWAGGKCWSDVLSGSDSGPGL